MAFLRLQPELHAIQIDYVGGPGGLLTAPDRLRSDLNDVVDLNVPITKFQFLTEAVLATLAVSPRVQPLPAKPGRWISPCSSYELNKRRPGVHLQRIKRVRVELQFPRRPASRGESASRIVSLARQGHNS